jgi:YidC/Oxa1 family membrane protein insertase
MLAEIGPFQALLDAIGWLLAWLYDLTGNFGFAIIILTIVFRVVLLPLGIKQIKSMQAMQALQPKIKEIQKKYKGNKQKIQEQTMKLYQEYGVNPLGGCLPLLLQFPILIAMYAVIRAPIPYAESDPSKPPGVEYKDNHYPEDSQLFVDVTQQDDEQMHFLLMNLQCTPSQSGKTVSVLNTLKEPSGATLDCGDSIADRIPYFLLLGLMIGSTYYSSRQTQRATPASAQNPQTQIITRVMPLMFGVFGFAFPAGLILYWTTSNIFQIGQQFVMLRLGHIGPQAMDRRLEEGKMKGAAKADKPRTGFMGKMMERADQERKRRLGEPEPPRKPPPRTSGSGRSGQGGTAKGGSARAGTGKGSGAKGSGAGGSGTGGRGRRSKGGSGPRRSGPNRPKGSGR